MNSDIFKRLYERSKNIVPQYQHDYMPMLEREPQQIRAETTRIREESKNDQATNANATFFLAQHGMQPQSAERISPRDVSRMFRPANTLKDTDVEKYLQQTHESLVTRTIDECRDDTGMSLEDSLDAVLESNWKIAQRRIMEEWDHQENRIYNRGDSTAPGVNMMGPSATAFQQRISSYAAVVSKLNDARARGEDFPIVDNLSKANKTAEPSSSSKTALGAWELVEYHTGESEAVQERMEGRFLRAYALRDHDKNVSTGVTNRLLNASRKWLEKQYRQYIDNTLSTRAMEAKVGGDPSPAKRIRAFMDISFKSGSRWSDPRFEIVNGTPIWLYVYLLLRSGYIQLALEYVQRNQDFFQLDGQFVQYFQEYVESPDRCLQKATRDAMLAEYQRLEYGQDVVDPYKLVLYKVIGRCVLNKKTVPDVVLTNEDYMWLQLSLVREQADSDGHGYERYQLSDLQNLLLKYGSKQFDPHGSSPWTYFKVLLLSLQFERAVNYLYKNEKSRLEAVHFAVALAYYGLLKVPEEPLTTSFDLLIAEDDGRVSLNFSRLIYQYVRTFAATNPENALQYIYLLTLYSDPHHIDQDDMVMLCQSYVRDLLLNSKDYKMILGSRSPEQGRQPGLLDRNRQLLGITSEKAFLNVVLLPIAEKYAQEGKYDEAVYVYELAADYDKVADVLLKQLGNALQQPSVPSIAGNAASAAAQNEQIINFSVQTLERYERQRHLNITIIPDDKEFAIRALISFLNFRRFYERGEYTKASIEIQRSGIIPVKDDFGEVQRSADLFERLDENITKNVPEVLLMFTDMLHKEWKSSIGPTFSMQGAAKPKLTEIKQAIRAILSFVGMIQFKMPADTVVQLNRAEMIILGASGC